MMTLIIFLTFYTALLKQKYDIAAVNFRSSFNFIPAMRSIGYGWTFFHAALRRRKEENRLRWRIECFSPKKAAF
jgi:hypothetical protein